MTERISLREQLASFDEHWAPKVVGELNGQYVKVVKFLGAYAWHHHDDEDEMFLVVEGNMRLEFRDKSVELAPGEFVIVPRGVEHRPVSEAECHVVLFEPATTRNTGNVTNELTVEPGELPKI